VSEQKKKTGRKEGEKKTKKIQKTKEEEDEKSARGGPTSTSRHGKMK
jgi:hypothetical protein